MKTVDASKETRPELIMRSIVPAVAILAGLLAPAAAQKVQIEATNAKWMEFFNDGDFDGVASLYTIDAIAFPPGAGMVKGSAAIGVMWKGMAEQVSDPKLTTLDVKRLGPYAAREIGTFSLKTKALTPKEVTGKYVVVWEKVGRDWKLTTDIWNDGTSNDISRRGMNGRSGDGLFDSFKHIHR
jgi:ketosteroid isomerase-like protein